MSEATTMIENEDGEADQNQQDQELVAACEGARKALAAADEARDLAGQEVVNFEARLAEARNRAGMAEDRRKALSVDAAQGDTSAARAFKKHTQEKEKADEDIAMLELAVPESKRHAIEADRAWYEAEADYQWAQFQILRANLESVSAKIDAHMKAVAGVIGERERILTRMNKCGVLGGMARTEHALGIQTLGEMLSALVKAPDTPAILKRPPFAEVLVTFPFGQTLRKKDARWLKSMRRPNAVKRWQAAQPTAAPGTGDPAASGMGHGWGAMPEQQTRRVPHVVTERTEVKLDGTSRKYPVDEPYEANPLTGARIIRHDDGGTRSVGIEYVDGGADDRVSED